MISRLLLAGTLLASVATVPASAQPATTQQALDALRAQYHLPALLAAVIEPDRIRYFGGGVKRNDQPGLIELNDYFHLGSETKGVTSLLAGKLVEQGKISWKSKLVDVVPALKDNIRPEYTTVTLDKLLSHRAGIQPYTDGRDHRQLPHLTGTTSEKRLQFAQFVLNQPPVAPPPGRRFAYSNAGYVLAALMLEQASHSSWEELVSGTFGVLKLRYLIGFPNRYESTQPWGHRLRPAGGSSPDSVFVPLGPTSTYQGYDYMAPAMELSMPLPDFARLIQLHLRGLLGQDNYLKSNTYQTLHFARSAYAYGWGVSGEANQGTLTSSHDGTTRTFFCHTVLYPGQRVALVVLTNAGGSPSVRQACHELAQQLRVRYLVGAL